ncbi:hypothetical protein MCEMIH15_00327 [Caulobacteraceae bacterium]
MTIFSLASSINDNLQTKSGSGPPAKEGTSPQLPSEPVLHVMRTALQCLGPLAPSDAMVLSRMLKRLFEIETDDGVVVAIDHAKELAEMLQLQKRAAR